MSSGVRDKHLQRRIQGLYSTDPQFADARRDNEITVAISRPGLRLAQIAAIVMEGYADRPALGQRAVQFVNDPGTGRTVAELLPRFDTIAYRELWDRAGAPPRWRTSRCGRVIECAFWVSTASTTPSPTWR
jgi:fatty acid CoA ligase FadD9